MVTVKLLCWSNEILCHVNRTSPRLTHPEPLTSHALTAQRGQVVFINMADVPQNSTRGRSAKPLCPCCFLGSVPLPKRFAGWCWHRTTDTVTSRASPRSPHSAVKRDLKTMPRARVHHVNYVTVWFKHRLFGHNSNISDRHFRLESGPPAPQHNHDCAVLAGLVRGLF